MADVWCVNERCPEYQIPKTVTPPPPGFEDIAIQCGRCTRPTQPVPE
jgi:hypothetical protein